ncbi:MAG: hypothetical protein ABNH53_08760 [Henriciella sp.]|jgi:hypothetical protein
MQKPNDRKSTAPGRVLLLGLMLAACGGTPAETASVAEPTEVPATTTEAASGDVTAEPVRTAAPPSGPIEAANVSDARDQLAQLDQDRRAYAMQTGSSLGSSIIDVTWEYGPCWDAASLLPPPMETWGIVSDLSRGEWPNTPKMARITYSSVDDTLEPTSAEYGASRENISIYISSGTPSVSGMADMYANEQLKDVMLAPGPFGYPIRKTPAGFPGRTVLLGDYLVQLDGTGKDMDRYFETIVKCGIQGGLIAEGVDPSSLQVTP